MPAPPQIATDSWWMDFRGIEALQMFLSVGRGGKAELFAVFGHGTACNFDAEAFVEACTDFLVGQRMGLIFVFYEGADTGLDAFRPDLTAVAGGEGAVEEVLQFKDAVGSADIFIGRDTAYAGFTSADILGYVLEYQRLELVDAVFEKVVLMLHDAFHDLIESPLPLFQAANHPYGGTQAVIHIVFFRTGTAFVLTGKLLGQRG